MHALTKRPASTASSTPKQEPNQVRMGEKEKFWFRSSRFFRAGDYWYFTTRENRDVGPFAEKSDADHGLEIFIECITKHGATVDCAINTARRGNWSITGFQ